MYSQMHHHLLSRGGHAVVGLPLTLPRGGVALRRCQNTMTDSPCLRIEFVSMYQIDPAEDCPWSVEVAAGALNVSE